MKTYKRVTVLNMGRGLGIHIEQNRDKFNREAGEILAEAPANKAFACEGEGLHGLVAEVNPDAGETWKDAWQDLGERLSHGLVDCHCGECEHD